MKQYIVDAFTSEPFSGNPAAVCVMDSWPSEQSMMKLAMENNLSETAFLVKEKTGYHLRWFTPSTEVELCGHATLASSYVILHFYQPDQNTVTFHTRSGPLTVCRRGELYEMNFPTYPLREIPVTDAMEQAFGVRPVKAVLGLDLVCLDRKRLCGPCTLTSLCCPASRAGFKMPPRPERRPTAYPAVFVRNWALRKTRSAVQPIARLQITGRRN